MLIKKFQFLKRYRRLCNYFVILLRRKQKKLPEKVPEPKMFYNEENDHFERINSDGTREIIDR